MPVRRALALLVTLATAACGGSTPAPAPVANAADLVILNPPRGGVGEGVMARLLGARPERIVYVSCDPATLARDVAGLGGGYHISRIRVFDLFPQTSRVETLLVLDRAGEGSVLKGGRPIRGDA